MQNIAMSPFIGFGKLRLYAVELRYLELQGYKLTNPVISNSDNRSSQRRVKILLLIL